MHIFIVSVLEVVKWFRLRWEYKIGVLKGDVFGFIYMYMINLKNRRSLYGFQKNIFINFDYCSCMCF